MKKLLTILLVLSILLVGGCKKDDTDYTAMFKQYQEDELYKHLASNKINAHFLIKDLSKYGLENMEASLGGVSDISMDDYRASLEALEKIDYSKLSEADQNVYDRYKKNLEKKLEMEGYEDLAFSFSPNGGANADLLTTFTEYVIRNKQDVIDAVEYLKDTKRFFELGLEKTKKQAEMGIQQSKATMEGIIEQIEDFLDSKDNCEIAKSLNGQIEKADFLSEEEKTDYKKQIIEAQKVVFEAYQEVLDYFIQAKETTTSTGSLASFEKGKEYYEVLLHQKTSSEMTPEEAKDLLVDYIDEQISKFMIYYYKATDYDFEFNYGYTEANEILAHLREAMVNDFPEIPDVDYTVAYLDPSVTSESIAAYYLEPTIDDINDNVIKVNPETEQLFSTLAHEGYPGHCYQITYELSNIDTPLTSLMDYLGYTEGWAVHVQQVAMDYTAETNSNIIKLQTINDNLFYPIMAYVDIMVHYDNATADEVDKYVADYFGEGLGQELYELACDDPGLYLPYGVGMAQMSRLVNKYKIDLGDKFNYVDFHRVILDTGRCNYEYLEAALDKNLK